MDNYGKGEPRAAQEPMYTRAGSASFSTGVLAGGGAPAPRQPTQIESLTRDLTQAANRLNLFNDNMEQKLEMFAGLNSPRGEQVGKEPSPPDGTLAALTYQSARVQHETERYGKLWERLCEIF